MGPTPEASPERTAPAAVRDLDRSAADLLRHVNRDHAGDVAGFVARGLGRAPGALAAAWITELGRYGAEVSWIDRHGLRSGELCFPVIARCRHHLADLLRAELRGGRLHL